MSGVHVGLRIGVRTMHHLLHVQKMSSSRRRIRILLDCDIAFIDCYNTFVLLDADIVQWTECLLEGVHKCAT